MSGNTYKGSRNIKGKQSKRKSSRKSSRNSSRNSSRRNSKNTQNETFVDDILSDMPKASVNLTKMDHAMGNRKTNGLINLGNMEYDPLHIQYLVSPGNNNMSHLNNYSYSVDQITGQQQQMMGQPMMPQMNQPMMPQMNQPMMSQMNQPMMFGSRENMEPQGMEPQGMENMEPQGQTGGADLLELLADRLSNNTLSSSELRKLRRILH